MKKKLISYILWPHKWDASFLTEGEDRRTQGQKKRREQQGEGRRKEQSKWMQMTERADWGKDGSTATQADWQTVWSEMSDTPTRDADKLTDAEID